MSEYSAKGLREKMKAKARSLAGEKDQKVDSSDWSPAEPLNADAKTGMRPISQRAYKKGGNVDGSSVKPRADRKARKSGGKVESEIGIGMANKNMKAANKDRPGVKHIGGMKTGGSVPSKAETQTNEKRIGKEQIVPKRGAAQHYKKGGRTKKADGGVLDNIVNALSGKGYIDGSTWIPKDEPVTASDAREVAAPVRRAAAPVRRRPAPVVAKRVVDPQYPYGDSTISGAESPMASDRFMKKGGKVKRAGRAMGGKDPSYVGASSVTRDDKPVMSPKDIRDTRQREPDVSDLYSSDQAKRLERGYKKGGRSAKATGGGLFGALKGATKKARGKGAKTDINIVINAGQKTPMRHPALGMAPPPDMAPPAGVGAAAPAMPPAPPPGAPMGAGPGLPPGLPGRKAGGRITKTASSYKDMEAGAASGEGRLQKTEIAKKGKDAPARKEGGRITKVAKSYKDMEAGAASGEGRLQKTDIAKAK